MLLMLLLHTRPWALTKQWVVRITYSANIYGGLLYASTIFRQSSEAER